MALNGWRRAFQTHDFEHTATTLQTRSDVFAHSASHLIVVGTHIGGVLL